jgi:phospholipid transport system substrate-binding protein
MTLSRRSFGALLGGAGAWLGIRAAHAAGPEPTSIIQSFYDTILDVMQHGAELGFDGRFKKLEPAIHQAFDVATMCKIAIGPAWTSMPTEKKNALLLTFDKFLVTTYAARFKSFGGQKFVVGAAKPVAGDRILVESKLIKSDGEPIELNYVFRQNQTGWQVIDIYLAGAISQMTQMRSDFSEPLRSGGVDGLIEQLEAKIAAMKAKA